MGKATVMTAVCQCTTGTAPSTLMVIPSAKVMAGKQPLATIMDNKPFANIMPFGTCNVLTAAAAGVPTPCVPATAAPWAPGSPTVKAGGLPVLNNSSKCVCTIGGMISINFPGQATVNVP